MIPTPGIIPPVPRLQLTGKDGTLTVPGLQLVQQYFKALNGLTPTLACTEAFSSNTYTLTPFNISPAFTGYYDFWSFAFVATDTSTGSVTATVVPTTGSIPTLPVYKSNGAVQAGAGDITSGLFYLFYFVGFLNSGNGGFVLK